METEGKVLEQAADYLEALGAVTISHVPFGVQVTTNAHSLFRAAPILAKAFRETALEYSEPGTVVICEHCLDNLDMAYAIIGGADG